MNKAKSTLISIFIFSSFHFGLCNDNNPIPNQIDSIKSQLEIAECDEQFYILLKLTAQALHSDPNLAESYLLDAKMHINEKSINKKLFDYYRFMVSFKFSQSHYKEVLELTTKALQLKFDGLDHKQLPYIYMCKADAYIALGEKVKAHQTLFKALNLVDSLKFDSEKDRIKIGRDKARIYNYIGIVYAEMDDHKMVEKYLLLALDKAKSFNDQSLMPHVLNNLAVEYINQQRYSEAEKLIFESIDLTEREGSGNSSIHYNNLGDINIEQKKYDRAIEFLQIGLRIAKEYQDRPILTHVHIGMSKAHMGLQNFALAKENIEKGLKMAKELNNISIYNPALQIASEIYENAGEHKEALNYYKQHTQLNDSLLNESRIKTVAELEEKYQSEKKANEILQLSKEKTSAERRERTLVQTIFLLCIGLLSLGSIFYFLRQKNIIQKKTLKISSDKIELLEKGKEIIALESLAKGQENERERLAKEMHDGLGGLLAISHSKLVNLKTPEPKVSAVINEARDLIKDAYDQVRQISHNLMPLDLEKFGLVESIRNMVQRINQQNEISIDFRAYHFNLLLNNRLGLNIYRITQEAIANILKSAKAKNVLIELFQHDDMISLSIEDDGIGFDVNAKDSGIGIHNMRNRAELLNGEFSIESKITKGTSIFVLFPYLNGELVPSSIKIH